MITKKIIKGGYNTESVSESMSTCVYALLGGMVKPIIQNKAHPE